MSMMEDVSSVGLKGVEELSTCISSEVSPSEDPTAKVENLTPITTKTPSSHRSQRLATVAKSSHCTSTISQRIGRKPTSNKKVGETKSVKKEKSSLKLIGLRPKPQKAKNTTATRPKVNKKKTKETSKKDDEKLRVQGFDAQTYEEFLLYRKFRQEIKRQRCLEKNNYQGPRKKNDAQVPLERNDEQVPPVDEEHELSQVEEDREPSKDKATVTHETEVSEGHDESEYLTEVDDSPRIKNNFTVSLVSRVLYRNDNAPNELSNLCLLSPTRWTLQILHLFLMNFATFPCV